MKNNELDNILDKVTDGIRAEQISDDLVSQSANRVWQRVSTEAGAPQMSANTAAAEIDRIAGCADFQSLIPGYLGGKLSEARSLLLVDHTHECIPCRRALKQAREKGVPRGRDVRLIVRAGRARTQVNRLLPVVLRWGIAAALVIGLGLIALPVLQRYIPLCSFDATVQAADGPLYLISDSQTRQLKAGEKINRGEVIRTAKDGHTIVRLGDGTTIEMKDRSEFSINRTLGGTTVQLGSGSVIVEAAKQQPRHTVVGKLTREFRKLFGSEEPGNFYVATNDSLVSVTGTTFAVNAGTKGSRVSVIEGEVHLDRNGTDRVLRPGEQATTNAAIDTVPVKDEVSWSRNAARYAKVLESLAALRKDLNGVQMPDARHSTRLLDMMPANTVFYAALPNLGATIAESNRIIQERIQQNPELRDWFASQRGPHGPAMNEAVTTIKEFGDQLGDEIAIGAGMNDQGQPTEPVVLAQLKNPGGFRTFVGNEVQKISANGKAPQIQ